MLGPNSSAARTGRTLFHCDALNALVRTALANNPDLEAARAGLAAAQSELRAAAGSALPRVVIATDATRARINGSFLYGPADAFSVTGERCSIGPSLAYSLDLFCCCCSSSQARRPPRASAPACIDAKYR